MFETLAFVARFAVLLGGLVVVGGILVRLIHRVTTRLILGWSIALSGLCLGFLAQAMTLTDSVAGAWDIQILTLLWTTPVGAAMRWHLAGLAIIAVSNGMPAKYGKWSALIGALIFLAGFVMLGHIADRTGLLLRIALFMHLAFAAYWVGVLIPLRRLAQDVPREAARVGHDFGRVAIFAVPVLLGLGGVMAVALLDAVEQLWTTAYGRFLVLKVLAVGAMLMLGAWNKVRHVPNLAAGHPNAVDALIRSLNWEFAAAVSVLAGTAALTTIAGLP